MRSIAALFGVFIKAFFFVFTNLLYFLLWSNFLIFISELLNKSHEKYGSIIKLWLSPTQLLVSIKDPLVINELLLKAADKLPLIGRVYRLAFGQSSFFVSSFEKVCRNPYGNSRLIFLKGHTVNKGFPFLPSISLFILFFLCGKLLLSGTNFVLFLGVMF